MSGTLKYLDDNNFENEIASGVTLVDFYADWCGPCRMIAPILDELAQELQGKVKIAKLNIDESQNVTARFGVTSIPTLIVFENGKEKDRVVGVRDKRALKSLLGHA